MLLPCSGCCVASNEMHAGRIDDGLLQDTLTPLEKFRRQKSKKGNAAEFMGLLQSLTKRW